MPTTAARRRCRLHITDMQAALGQVDRSSGYVIHMQGDSSRVCRDSEGEPTLASLTLPVLAAAPQTQLSPTRGISARGVRLPTHRIGVGRRIIAKAPAANFIAGTVVNLGKTPCNNFSCAGPSPPTTARVVDGPRVPGERGAGARAPRGASIVRGRDGHEHEDLREIDRSGRRCAVCRSGRNWRKLEVVRRDGAEPVGDVRGCRGRYGDHASRARNAGARARGPIGPRRRRVRKRSRARGVQGVQGA